CQFVDVDDGGDFGGLFFFQFHSAEGAIGLEDPKFLQGFVVSALGSGLVAGETVEDGGGIRVGEVLRAAGGDPSFDFPEACEVPGGMKELVEGEGFDGALRSEFGRQRLLERREFFLFLGANYEVPGGEAVPEGVLGNARLAFRGAGSGGALSVGL